MADQKELVRRLAFAKQILPRVEAVIARATGEQRDLLRLEGGKERMLLHDSFKPLHRAPPSRSGAARDGGGLFGDVDADGAPGDAPAAADAAGRAELVDPVGELVGHPLPVARGPEVRTLPPWT